LDYSQRKNTIKKEYKKFFPYDHKISVVGTYQAEFDATITRLPHIEYDDDVYIAYGLNGHGLALAYGIGKEISDHISKGKSKYFAILVSNLYSPVFPKVPFLGRFIVTAIIKFKKLFNKI